MENSLDIEKINKATISFLTPLSSEQMYAKIVDEAKRILNGIYGTIFIAKDGKLERVYADGEFLKRVKIKSKGNTYKAYKEHIPLILDVKDLRYHLSYKEKGIQAVIHIPLSYKNETIGDLVIYCREKKNFRTKDTHLLKLLGAMASLAIKKTQLYSQTREALEARDEFISLASHELRTPLTSINGYIQLLHSRLAKQNSIESKWIDELYRESRRLTNLVKELLEINRIKAGKLQFDLQECEMDKVILNAVEVVQSVNEERNILFENKVNEKQVIIGDFQKLLQVIIAILSNAIKFSPKDSPISVSLDASKKHAFVKIVDQGKGIAREDIGKIFEGFHKGEGNYAEGIGVGLLLAKHTINYHHGMISVRSKPKKGTIVEVKLPKIHP